MNGNKKKKMAFLKKAELIEFEFKADYFKSISKFLIDDVNQLIR